MSAPEWGVFGDYARGLLSRKGIPGMAVAVAVSGDVVYTAGLGFRDVDKELPVTEDTVFGIGSITKSFTSLAIMQLASEGKLSVWDPVKKHLPEFAVGDPDFSAPMTIHHFMTHSAGIPPLPSLLGAMARSLSVDPSMDERLKRLDVAALKPIDTPVQLMESIAGLDVSPLGPPGTIYSYSNDCYALLGTIIERVTGRTYQDEIMDRVITPLGLRHTGFDLDSIATDEITNLYVKSGSGEGGKVEASPLWWESPAMVAAGFVRSTARDLLRYLEAYRDREATGVLSPTARESMLTPYIDSTGASGYGYGFGIQPDYHGYTLVEHGGGIKGVAAHVTLVPEADVTVAVLTNIAGAPAGAVALAAVNTALGLPLSTRRVRQRHFTYPRDHLARFAGRYVSGEGFSGDTEITLTDEGLEARVDDEAMEVRFLGPERCQLFGPDDDEGTVARFLSRPSGEVWAVLAGGRVWRRSDGGGLG